MPVKTLAQRLIAEERRTGRDSDHGGRAAFRVCEKLQLPLCTVAGVAGFTSLLSRARVLALAEAPILAGVLIKPDGSLEYSAAMEAQLETSDAAKAGTALVGHLFGLLSTFIGETLTLRLVQEVWPKVTVEDPKLGKKCL
jgi:hypothetical protein